MTTFMAGSAGVRVRKVMCNRHATYCTEKRVHALASMRPLRSHGSPIFPSPWIVKESLSLPTCAAHGLALNMLTSVAYLQGACGYGYIKKNEWPYWSVGALTPSNQFAKAGPAHACGCADLSPYPTSCLRSGSSPIRTRSCRVHQVL